MTAKCALAIALLRGDVISIRTGFLDLGITNVPREIGRCIERESEWGFGVVVSRVKKEGLSRHGVPCVWFEYRLNKTPMNAKGIEKMKAYIKEQLASEPPAKTEKALREQKRQQAALNF